MAQTKPAEERTTRLKPLRHPLDPEVCQKASRYAVRVAEEMSRRSVLLSRENDGGQGSSSGDAASYANSGIQQFRREEILPYLGEMLGKGGFNNVYELDLKNRNKKDSKKNEDQTRLAIKFLSDDAMYSPEDFCNGAADLLMEAKYLTALADHPHPSLIQLHGVCAAGPAGFKHTDRAGFFLILDRLYDTLDRRIDVWKDLKRRKRPSGSGLSAANEHNRVMQALWMQRLLVCQEIASALVHLHHLQIVFRDLKPDNVGFDFAGKVKLFDFGLAKELDPQQKIKEGRANAGMYEMSGGTGSRRFMAPEVALSEPYHLSADMYSFSILMWEILSLEKAFGNLSVDEHREQVVVQNERLPTDSTAWGPGIVDLLEGCWCRNTQNRWTAREVKKKLKYEIQNIYQETFCNISRQQE